MVDRPRRRLRRALITLGVSALVGVSAVVGSAAHVAIGAQGRVYHADDVPERAVAMVLGAKADPGRPSAFLAARLDVAVALFESGRIRAILVTGDGRPRSNDEPKVMKDYLVERGVPAAQIVEDPAGFDTYDSCVRARDVYGVTELTVITQDYHLNRAIAICRAVQVDAVGVADTTIRGQFPALWAKGASREWLANLKMEWDLLSQRSPQVDPADSSLLEAAGLA